MFGTKRGKKWGRQFSISRLHKLGYVQRDRSGHTKDTTKLIPEPPAAVFRKINYPTESRPKDMWTCYGTHNTQLVTTTVRFRGRLEKNNRPGLQFPVYQLFRPRT